ncbi:MAG: ADP-ribosylglycohydrolase family protein [Rhodospirillales bacterium]|nr:ADP-ribosylglycohydrolase family protein [Rhodospirillales bacterium]
MEAFPVNKRESGHIVLLGPHYTKTLKALGHTETQLPDSLYFTFCGDILGSSGEHYTKGHPISFFDACDKASLSFSDDFMTSLAMHILREDVFSPDLPGLLAEKEKFFDLIAAHFEALSQTYSPWFGALRNAKEPGPFLDIIYGHGSCGAAMRAAVLAADGVEDEQAFNLLLITHGHTEALEGGMWVKGMADAAIDGRDFNACLRGARDKSRAARTRAADFHADNGLPSQLETVPPFEQFIQDTLSADDPYATICDIAEEGIETRFVVGAVMHVLRQIWDRGMPEQDIPYLVAKSLEIGGDPDTICSIAMGLYGLRWPNESRIFLNEVGIGTPEIDLVPGNW